MSLEIIAAESLGVRSLCCVEGEVWLEKLSATVARKVYCAADFMGKPRQLLEAKRALLYNKMPVADGWHDDYAKGLVDPDDYLDAIENSSAFTLFTQT